MNNVVVVAILERIKARGEKILKENHPRNTSRINSHSVFWMVAALAVFYYSDFYIALRVDSRIHRSVSYMLQGSIHFLEGGGGLEESL